MEHRFRSILRIYKLINLKSMQLLGKTTLLASTSEYRLHALLTTHSLFFIRNHAIKNKSKIILYRVKTVKLLTLSALRLLYCLCRLLDITDATLSTPNSMNVILLWSIFDYYSQHLQRLQSRILKCLV